MVDQPVQGDLCRRPGAHHLDDDSTVQEAFAAGASGSLLEHAAPADLVAAIRRCAAGDSWLNPAIVGGVLGALRCAGRRTVSAPRLLATLTAREREVLVLHVLTCAHPPVGVVVKSGQRWTGWRR
ncbi:response regulator transcription factor [Nocardia mangyaensis]|uniref:response regulator transcription factor n=1 Tax=Nocardia mangyaensis TaxID=2213200 RepID=UPI0019826262|nr:response regulator transcription factor [Nocardia mangyaensis]